MLAATPGGSVCSIVSAPTPGTGQVGGYLNSAAASFHGPASGFATGSRSPQLQSLGGSTSYGPPPPGGFPSHCSNGGSVCSAASAATVNVHAPRFLGGSGRFPALPTGAPGRAPGDASPMGSLGGSVRSMASTATLRGASSPWMPGPASGYGPLFTRPSEGIASCGGFQWANTSPGMGMTASTSVLPRAPRASSPSLPTDRPERPSSPMPGQRQPRASSPPVPGHRLPRPSSPIPGQRASLGSSPSLPGRPDSLARPSSPTPMQSFPSPGPNQGMVRASSPQPGRRVGLDPPPPLLGPLLGGGASGPIPETFQVLSAQQSKLRELFKRLQSLQDMPASQAGISEQELNKYLQNVTARIEAIDVELRSVGLFQSPQSPRLSPCLEHRPMSPLPQQRAVSPPRVCASPPCGSPRAMGAASPGRGSSRDLLGGVPPINGMAMMPLRQNTPTQQISPYRQASPSSFPGLGQSPSGASIPFPAMAGMMAVESPRPSARGCRSSPPASARDVRAADAQRQSRTFQGSPRSAGKPVGSAASPRGAGGRASLRGGSPREVGQRPAVKQPPPLPEAAAAKQLPQAVRASAPEMSSASPPPGATQAANARGGPPGGPGNGRNGEELSNDCMKFQKKLNQMRCSGKEIRSL